MDNDVILVNVLRTFNLYPQKTFDLTRVFGATASQIDNIFLNFHELTMSINKSGISDYYGLELFLRIRSLPNKNVLVRERRLISSPSIDKIKNKTNSSDWNMIFRNPNVNISTPSFVTIIKYAINDICSRK